MRVGTEPHAVEADYAFRDRPWGDAPCGWRGRRGGGLALCGEGLTRLPRTPRGPRSSSRAPEKTLFFFFARGFLAEEPRSSSPPRWSASQGPATASAEPISSQPAPPAHGQLSRGLTFPQGPGRVVSHALPASAQRPTLALFAVRLAAAGAGSKDSSVPARPAGPKYNFGATGPWRGRREVIQDGS